MRPKTWVMAGLLGFLPGLVFAAPKGTVARAAAEKYALHASQDGIGIGLVLLSQEQARKQFVSDMNRCCVVVEIALYPDGNKPLSVSLDDFAISAVGSESASKPASAKVVASTLQKKAADTRDVSVYPSVGVGYGSGGYDPATGTRTPGGTYKQVGVGVGIGSNGPQAGSTDKDRAAMETELSEEGLPEGSTSAPVAGYVYFPITPKKGTSLQLSYLVNGQRVVLKLPR
jgi:hypothetical protein